MDTCESSNYNFIKIVSYGRGLQCNYWRYFLTVEKAARPRNCSVRSTGRGIGQTAEHHQWSQERSPRVLVILRLMRWIEFLFSWDNHVQTAPEHHLQRLEKQFFASLRFCRPGAWFSCSHLGIWNNFEISYLSLSRFSRCNKLCDTPGTCRELSWILYGISECTNPPPTHRQLPFP